MVLRAKGPNLKELNNRIKIIELKKNSSIGSIFIINRYIKKKKIDVAIGTLAMAYVISLANLFGRKDCKYIARIGNTISPDLSNLSFFKKLIMIFYQKVLNFSDVIISQSKSMNLDLKKYISRKTITIYNPIIKKNILNLSKKKNLIVKLNRNYYNIISVGRLTHQKDYKTAILAISKLKHKIKNIRYYIAGEGKLKNELYKYSLSLGLKDDVIFTGFLKNPYSIMKDANVLLLSSLYEGFSNVILESLSLNVPVVATNSLGGNKEIISNGKNGFLAEVGNSDDIVKKLMLIKNKNNFQIDVSKFEISLIGKKYEKNF
jgi:glycosyltransferase involved in cell wall biosynthesis